MKLLFISSFQIESNGIVSLLPVQDQTEFWILVFLALLYSPINIKDLGLCVV